MILSERSLTKRETNTIFTAFCKVRLVGELTFHTSDECVTNVTYVGLSIGCECSTGEGDMQNQ